MFGAYIRLLETRPLLTKVVTSTVLFGAGDALSQSLEGKASFDGARFVRMAAWGAIFTPFAHVWYGALDKMIPGAGAVNLATKVAADQVGARARRARDGAARSALTPAPCVHARARSSRGPSSSTAVFSGRRR